MRNPLIGAKYSINAAGIIPAAEPTNASNTLSASTIRKMRPAGNPMALKTASSRVRSRKLIIMVLPATIATMERPQRPASP